MGTTAGAQTRYRKGKPWPKKCRGPGKYQHCKGCHPKRPKCRWRRQKYQRKYALCTCGCYPFTHRKRSGICGDPAKQWEAMTGTSYRDGRKLSGDEIPSRYYQR